MESLILSILGDIIGFKIKKKQFKITKKKFGDSFIRIGKTRSFQHYIGFIGNGGVTEYFGKDDYSFCTLILFATIKGIINHKDLHVSISDSCKKQYIKLYEKHKEQNLTQKYYINNANLESLSNLKNNIIKSNQNNELYNDSMVIIRAIPFGLIYYKKEDRKKLIEEIIYNIKLTHDNTTCFLGAISLGLFLTYSKNNIPDSKWGSYLVDYLESSDFDDIIKDMKLYDNEFIINKEDYISLWKEYLHNTFKYNNQFKYNTAMQYPDIRAENLYYITENKNEFIYGIRADDSLIVAYNALLYSNENWQNVIVHGVLGITDNSVIGVICGALYGCQYKFKNIWMNKYVNEIWLKKTIKLGKSLGL